MIRAKHIATASVVLSLGVGMGLANVAAGGGDTARGADAATLYLLEPAIAEQPVIPEVAPAVVRQPTVLRTLMGSASYYANSLAGRRTASGVPYNPKAMIAAHKTLPFGSRLRVTNEANGRTVEVEVVDRGPYAKGRVLDLSRTAAEQLGFIQRGHTQVKIEVLE